MQTDPTCQPDAANPPNSEFRPSSSSMKALRIELRREFLDQLRGEGERSQFTPLPDHEILEETHQRSSAAVSTRRSTMIGVTMASRPMESHHRPLTDPSVRLAPHWAPIRKTSRVCRSSSV
jgi:hypothetical protein